MFGEVLKTASQNFQYFLSYWRQTTRGSFGAPIRLRVNSGNAALTVYIVHVLLGTGNNSVVAEVLVWTFARALSTGNLWEEDVNERRKWKELAIYRRSSNPALSGTKGIKGMSQCLLSTECIKSGSRFFYGSIHSDWMHPKRFLRHSVYNIPVCVTSRIDEFYTSHGRLAPSCLAAARSALPFLVSCL